MVKNSFISSFDAGREYKVRTGHICIFVGLFTVSMVCLEITNRIFFVSRSKNFNIISALEKKKDHLEVVFVGDSHFQKGIDAQSFENSAFNLSFGRASYIQSYYVLKRYIPQMPSLKLVVIPVDLHTFSAYKIDDIDTPFFWSRFVDSSEVSRLTGRKIFAGKFNLLTILDKRLGQEYFVKNVTGTIRRFLFREPKPPTYEERVWADRKQVADKESALSRAKYHLRDRDAFDEAIFIYFKKILKICKENDIQVVILHMPVSKDYAEGARKYIKGNEREQLNLDDPAYGTYVCRNLDFHNVYFDRDDFFYYEGDHLNPKGRKAFSKLLERQISGIIREVSD